MKTILFSIYLLCPPDTAKYEEQILIAKFTDGIKKENILYLQFTDTKKNNGSLMLLKAKPYPMYFIPPKSMATCSSTPPLATTVSASGIKKWKAVVEKRTGSSA